MARQWSAKPSTAVRIRSRPQVKPRTFSGFFCFISMNRLFLLIVFSMVLLAIEYYSYQGLKVAVGSTSDAFQRVSKFLFFALSTITFTGFILFEPLSKNAATRSFLTFFMTIGIANILGKILFAIWLLIDDLIRLARLIWAKLNPQVEVVQESSF